MKTNKRMDKDSKKIIRINNAKDKFAAVANKDPDNFFHMKHEITNQVLISWLGVEGATQANLRQTEKAFACADRILVYVFGIEV